MALTSGFYDSEGHDRKYSAMQFGTIFDGVINDGVFEHYEKAFIVKDTGGLNQNAVIIQPGRAWFNHTWTYNDADLLFAMPEQSLALDRIDALVLRVDHLARENTFEVVMGVESSTPEKPTIVNHGPDIFDYPLAYIYRTADVSEINARDIENTVGTSECPFSTGLIEGITTDELVAQWSAQWADWSNEKRAEFIEWFNNIQYVLDGDVAGHLQNEIDDIITELQEILSPVSAGDGGTATRSIAFHELFYSTEDQLVYRAIEPIEPGDTLTFGQNIVAVGSVGRDMGRIREEMNAYNSQFTDQLTANNNPLYMNYHDGKYGINTSPTRGADTFIPFRNGNNIVTYTLRAGGTFVVTEDCTAKIFLFVCNDCVGWNGSWGTSATLTLNKNGTAVASVSSSASVPERGAALGYNSTVITLELKAGDRFTIGVSTYLCNGGGYADFSML